MGKQLKILLAGSVALSVPAMAAAAETATYTYDALGRLTAVSIAGGPAAGTNAGYTYDVAGNRSQTTVSTPLALIGVATKQKMASSAAKTEKAASAASASAAGGAR